MKLNFYSFVIGLLFLIGCTDVPLSYNKAILNRQILGFWQLNDSIALEIREDKINNVVYMQSYEFDTKSKVYQRAGDKSILFFTDLVINGEKHQFVSYESGKTEFENREYKFFKNGDLALQDFNTSLEYDKWIKEKNFGTTSNFQNYIREKISTPKRFYSSVIVLQKRQSLYNLTPPNMNSFANNQILFKKFFPLNEGYCTVYSYQKNGDENVKFKKDTLISTDGNFMKDYRVIKKVSYFNNFANKKNISSNNKNILVDDASTPFFLWNFSFGVTFYENDSLKYLPIKQPIELSNQLNYEYAPQTLFPKFISLNKVYKITDRINSSSGPTTYEFIGKEKVVNPNNNYSSEEIQDCLKLLIKRYSKDEKTKNTDTVWFKENIGIVKWYRNDFGVTQYFESKYRHEEPKVGDYLSDFTQYKPDKTNFSLKDLKGQNVLFIFWASWCRPCMEENKKYFSLLERYKNIKIIGVSLDKDYNTWVNGILSENFKWDNISDLNGWYNEIVVSNKIDAIPNTILINKEGKIISINAILPILESQLNSIPMK